MVVRLVNTTLTD